MSKYINRIMDDTRSKILLLITNLGQGGAQRVYYDHSLFLSEQYAVIEAVFDKNEYPDLYQSGNKLISLDVKGSEKFINKIINFIRRCIRLRSIIHKQSLSLCISHMDGANWVNILSFSRAKKILVVHGTVLHDNNQNKWMQILRKRVIIPLLYNRADITVAVSDGIKYELQRFCHVRNVITIPNFFDIASIKTKATEPLSPEWEALLSNYNVLISSGRFNEQKKQRYLFPLVKRLRSQDKNIRLVLLGDGPLRSELFKEANDYGLSFYDVWDENKKFSEDYDIYFAGYTSNPFQYLRRSKLFLFPSGWEGFPMALCEAMISGVPVLSADCPTGPRQILAPESFDPSYALIEAEQTSYGWLMPMANKSSFEEEWVNTISIMLYDGALRKQMSENALERMRIFSKERVVTEWKQVINRILKQQ